MLDFSQLLEQLGYVGAVALILGMAFVLISILFSLVLFIMGPDSIRSGEEFATEFHRAATGNAIGVRRRLFFAFKWWPITMDGRQTLPYFTAKFKRFYFLLSAMEWCTYGVCAIKYRKKFYAMIFSNVIANIAVILGITMLFAGLGAEADLFADLKPDAIIIVIGGASAVILGFAMQIYPAYVMRKYMYPVIDKMNISDNDKSKLRFAVKVQFMLAVATMILNILRTISEVYNKNKKKSG